MNRRCKIAISALILLTVAACASQPYVETENAPGFFMGILHGFISWIALIAHIFNPDIRVYAYPNSGGWYDLGFLLGLSFIGGGAAASR